MHDRGHQTRNRACDLRIVDERSLSLGVEMLCERSRLIRDLVDRYGSPPLWKRDPGFASLVYAILEQQVSLASARAVYERLVEHLGELTPRGLLALEDQALRSLGFSRQKISYCRGLSTLIDTGTLDLADLERLDDEAIITRLTSVKGIGRWTAEVYLLHSLGRPDVWPVGDLALKVAIQETFSRPERPDERELEEIGHEWRPLRSVAARVLWQGYLSRRGIPEVT